jgi:ribosomal protein S12 methylthiotransferase
VAGLLEQGFKPLDDPEGADVVVVNTCAFIQPAVEEALDHLLAAATLKKEGRVGFVVALGCLPQRYGQDLAMNLNEVDLFVTARSGDKAAEKIKALVEGGPGERYVDSSPAFLYSAATPRALTTGPGTAYLKVAEGCPNACSYCTIPLIRGRQRSRPPEDILQELAGLGQEGVNEVILVAQDLTAYGRDLENGTGLTGLLAAIQEQAQGPEWVRLLYLNPGLVTAKLLEVIAREKRILPYLDLPLQHSAPGLIKAMNRRPPAEDTFAWIQWVRSLVPGAVLRTSLMVGFPGETESDFLSLLEFVEKARLDHVGGFAFCPEPETKAARMENQVPAEVARERLEKLLEVQKGISLELNQNRVGQEVEVLVEGPHPETELLLSARAWFQAPEIDGRVIIRSGQGLPGAIQRARIVEAHPYDLVAELED